MKKLLGITLGIMTALGGFVDLGQIVFTMQAGAHFRYELMWAIVLGTVGIIIYMEMCGRIAVVSGEPVFETVRDRLGKTAGWVTLVASNLLNLLTCAAEIGGIAILLHLLTGWNERVLMPFIVIFFATIVYLLKFEWIERTFGLAGLMMIVFAISAVAMHPDWSGVARGVLPTAHPRGGEVAKYLFFAVGIFSAMLMEYEVHFYSSGAIEEKWTTKELGENTLVATLGSVLGALLTVALLILGATVLLPREIVPQTLSTTTMTAAVPFGTKALIIAALGSIACLSGATIETALSGGYNLSQFLGKKWGKEKEPKSVPFFTKTWLAMLAAALAISMSGIAPLKLVDISVVFGMLVLPFTYYPILRAASDKSLMGKHVNGRMDNAFGMIFLILITIAALAAIPLMILGGD